MADTTLSKDDLIGFAINGGMDWANAWNYYQHHITTESRLAAVEATAGLVGFPFIDLRVAPYGVVANDSSPAQALLNAQGINAAITAYTGLKATLMLPYGEVWIDKAGSNWSINFSAVSDLELRGQGPKGTVLVQSGAGTGADWNGIRIHNSSRIRLANFGIRQDEIQKPSSGQHDHLIQVLTLASGVTDSITIEDVWFGKVVGDGLSFVGDDSPVTNCRVSRCWFKSDGEVIRRWAATTAYTADDVVLKGNNGYLCTVGGTSGAVGPTATVEDGTETDGTVTWKYKQNYHRTGGRACASFQRGYSNVVVENCYFYGAQNSPIDMEATAADTSPTMRFARFYNCYVDNSFGRTSIAMSFTGAHADVADSTEYAEMRDCTFYQGRLQVAETTNAVLSNVRVIMTEPPDGDETIANIEIRYVNQNLVLDNVQCHRVGTSAAGHLIDISGTGPVFINGGYFVQATAGNHIVWESMSDMTVSGGVFIDTNATAGRFVISANATTGTADRPTIRGLTIRATGGLMEAAVALASRSTHSMAQVSITDIQHTGCERGVYMSREATSGMDTTPVIMNVGAWQQVNESDNPITVIYPITGGNRGGVAVYEGEATPAANLAAIQGSTCVFKSGDSTELFFKATNTTSAGWVQIT